MSISSKHSTPSSRYFPLLPCMIISQHHAQECPQNPYLSLKGIAYTARHCALWLEHRPALPLLSSGHSHGFPPIFATPPTYATSPLRRPHDLSRSLLDHLELHALLCHPPWTSSVISSPAPGLHARISPTSSLQSIANYLEDQPTRTFAVELDADFVQGAHNISLNHWIDYKVDMDVDLAFYERSWIFEIASGNYMVLYSPLAIAVLKYWSAF